MDSLLIQFARDYLNLVPKYATILDVGCGTGPYWALRPDVNWLGLDIYPSPNSNFVIEPNGTFPIEKNSIEYVLCTQVLEHVQNPKLSISEIFRILKPGGIAIVNMPFIYPFHGMPDDSRRWTTTELIFAFRDFEIIESGGIGGIGSSLVTLWLNFCEYKLVQTTIGKLLKIIATPALWFQSFILNLAGRCVDKIDSTSSFPTNTFIVVRKPLIRT
jgi:SAM-dependent methyltransferase